MNLDDAFEAKVGPVRDGLTKLLDAADNVRDSWGHMPAEDSKAMAELAEEASYRGDSPWGQDPVQAAHNTAQLLAFGANDCARAMIRLLDSESPPVYAHIVLARAVLEHAGRAWWLLDPRIGVRLRIARGMNERLNGLSEQGRLPLNDEDKTRAKTRRAALFAEAERHGFRKVRRDRSTPPTLEEERPGQTALIKLLLREQGDVSLGAMVYGLFSAVAHGTTFGLSSSVTMKSPGLPKTPGTTWGALYTDADDVVAVLTAALLGVGLAVGRRNTLFGWRSDSWNDAWKDAVRTAKRSLPDTP